MTTNVFKDLGDYEYQVFDTKKTFGERKQYRFYFRNIKTNEIGIPIINPKYSIKESRVFKFIETWISNTFKDLDLIYLQDRNFFISATLNDKELSSLEKEFKSLFLKKNNEIINGYNGHINYLILEENGKYYVSFYDSYDSSKNSFIYNAKFKQISFLMEIEGLKHLQDNIWYLDINSLENIGELESKIESIGFVKRN